MINLLISLCGKENYCRTNVEYTMQTSRMEQAPFQFHLKRLSAQTLEDVCQLYRAYQEVFPEMKIVNTAAICGMYPDPFWLLVYNSNSSLVAFLTFEFTDKDVLFFYNLGVLPGYRRQGIFQTMIKYLQNEIAPKMHLEAVSVSCLVRNQEGHLHAMYEKQGLRKSECQQLNGQPVKDGYSLYRGRWTLPTPPL